MSDTTTSGLSSVARINNALSIFSTYVFATTLQTSSCHPFVGVSQLGVIHEYETLKKFDPSVKFGADGTSPARSYSWSDLPTCMSIQTLW